MLRPKTPDPRIRISFGGEEAIVYAVEQGSNLRLGKSLRWRGS